MSRALLEVIYGSFNVAAIAAGAHRHHNGGEKAHGPHERPEDDKEYEAPVGAEEVEGAHEEHERRHECRDRARQDLRRGKGGEGKGREGRGG